MNHGAPYMAIDNEAQLTRAQLTNLKAAREFVGCLTRDDMMLVLTDAIILGELDDLQLEEIKRNAADMQSMNAGHRLT